LDTVVVAIIASVTTIVGAGISSYLGVRTAQAEMKRDIAYNARAIEEETERRREVVNDLRDRVIRLESPHFRG
jgi:vacuolar-type H+-ATPase catalytic subunit A/Vma1